MPHARIGQADLHYYEEGEGLPLVLVHGFPLTHRMWQRQIPALAADYRVIAPDLRGFGESSYVEGRAAMETYAADLAGLLDALEVGSTAIAGFSMGGYAALAFLRDYRDRVAGLALVDSKATADTPEAKQGRAQAAEKVLAQGAGFMADAMIGKLLAPATLDREEVLVQFLLDMMGTQSPDAIAQALLAMADRPDSTGLLAGIAGPSLVVAGSEDVIASVDEQRSMAGAMPDCEFVEIAGAGHLTPLERPDAVTGALRTWLSRLYG